MPIEPEAKVTVCVAATVAPKVSVVDQLAHLGVKPEQIQYVGISHYHADHTGQVDSFPQATLLIGKGDWDAITAPKPAAGVNAPPFARWISGGGKVEPQPTDKDVFGDREMARRREAHEAADKACIAFCRDVEAVSVGDAGVCACPVRGPE